MPYGLPNETPSKTSKMERCVDHLMSDPDFKPRGGEDKKTAAIKVCKSTIMGTSAKQRGEDLEKTWKKK